MKRKKLLWIIVGILLLCLIAGMVGLFGFYMPKQKEHKAHQAAVAQYRANKTAQYQQENEKYGDYEVDVAFLGDSLTDGYDVKKYYPQFLVVNRGIGGDTTFDLENRLQVSVYDLKPKVAVLLIGGNNPETMFDNYERILQGFQQNIPETKIVLVSLISMSQEWGKKNHLAAFNNVKIKMLADKYSYDYVDLYSPLLNPQTNEMYAGYSVDGAHQTPAGYEVFTAHITPVLERLLQE